METVETLVHSSKCIVAGGEYEIHVYTRLDGLHIAKTILGPNDVVINDAPSLQEVLDKHRQLLTLAIDSRLILRDFQDGRSRRIN